MTKRIFFQTLASLSALLLAGAMQAQSTDASTSTTSAQGNSKVRIVRLSEVKGDVKIKHEDDRAFESAMANLPIVEGSRLRTGTGVAEVEFEDNSTLRIGPDSIVVFPQLERTPTGKTASTVQLVQGIAYVSLLKSTGNQFTLKFGERNLDLQPGTHLRLQIDGSDARLAVLDGMLNMDSAAGPVTVAKKKTASFDITNQSQPTITKDFTTSELDSWDHDAAAYHSRVASNGMMSSSPYAYGTNDMMYYGSFMDGGCGSMWRPYFASAAWNPFSNGSWAWYPGAGYSWVSPYPWAWTPYHFGAWSYCAGSGWGWMPGGAWNGLNNVGILTPPTSGSGSGIVAPHPPVRAPRLGEPTRTAINVKPLVQSGLASPDKFQFRKDSAGMGVPRETLGRLDKFSQKADSRGISSTPVFVSSPGSANGRMNNSETLGNSIHRGPDPGNGMGGQPAYPGMGGGGGRMGPAPGAMHPGAGGSMPMPSGGPSPGGGGARPAPH